MALTSDLCRSTHEETCWLVVLASAGRAGRAGRCWKREAF